jgi:hypothetical protein
MKLKKELADQEEEQIAEVRPPLGSITKGLNKLFFYLKISKGTPNRSRNLLIETSISQPAPTTTEANNLLYLNEINAAKQKTIQGFYFIYLELKYF